MNALKNKLSKKGGFTLVEMLIVVAIIAILIAISIPLINAALERARDNTDRANLRACKAEVILLTMGMAEDASGNPITLAKVKSDYTGGNCYYDAATGGLKTTNAGIQGYGQCTKEHKETTFDAFDMGHVTTNSNDKGSHAGKVIKIIITADDLAKFGFTWEDAA